MHRQQRKQEVVEEEQKEAEEEGEEGEARYREKSWRESGEGGGGGLLHDAGEEGAGEEEGKGSRGRIYPLHFDLLAAMSAVLAHLLEGTVKGCVVRRVVKQKTNH